MSEWLYIPLLFLGTLLPMLWAYFLAKLISRRNDRNKD